MPENLKEPFYRDHEGQDHLKPQVGQATTIYYFCFVLISSSHFQIVVELGNATLYCQTLANLYSDPNYQSLNHWSILQTLARKGVPLNELNNVQLTETVLIQTNPLRVAAHMSVIEALMVLYAKEIATRDRISAVINRISGGALPDAVQGYENALLYWVSHASAALKRRIDYEIEMGATDENVSRGRIAWVGVANTNQGLVSHFRAFVSRRRTFRRSGATRTCATACALPSWWRTTARTSCPGPRSV